MAKPPANDKNKGEEVPDWSTIKGLGKDFDDLAHRLAVLEDELSPLLKQQKELKNELATVMLKARVKKVQWRGRPAVRTEGVRKTLSKDKLLAKRVPLKTIMACYNETPWVSFRLYKPGEDEGEE
jgi:hypothetical protein